MGDTQEEKRKSVRIKKSLVVRYSYSVNNGNKKWEETVIRDISETGMSINTSQSLLPNDTVALFIKIPFRPLDWVEFAGKVVRCEVVKHVKEVSRLGAYITGLEFIGLTEEQRKIIKEYIAWFLSKPH